MNSSAATLDHLARLVSFPTISAESNLALIGWVREYLTALGYRCLTLPDATGSKAGLLARIGPDGPGGIMLSAHSDVVPVEGQVWASDPFALRKTGDRLYGRGTADMKGFLACTLTAAAAAAQGPLSAPFLLSLSYDEEVGCTGIRAMMPGLLGFAQPDLCIVGEPTTLQIATGHKGKAVYRVVCRGQAGHSAQAPHFVNALHLGADMIGLLRREQVRLGRHGLRDSGYDVAHSTIHAGMMTGGTALNIVPDYTEILFEIRHLAGEAPADILCRIAAGAARIVARSGKPAGISIEQTNAYPGFEVPQGAPPVRRLATLLDNPFLTKVAFGTEAGVFAAHGIPALVCGPGSMDQGHQPDEFITTSQLVACDAFLTRLVASLR